MDSLTAGILKVDNLVFVDVYAYDGLLARAALARSINVGPDSPKVYAISMSQSSVAYNHVANTISHSIFEAGKKRQMEIPGFPDFRAVRGPGERETKDEYETC